MEKKYVPPTIPPDASEEVGEVVGIFAGDGSQYFEPKKYAYEVNVHFGITNFWYAWYVRQLYESFFQKKFRLQREGKTQLRLRTSSKEIYAFFSKHLVYDSQIKHSTVKLRKTELPTSFKLGFLLGLFDTDGHVSLDKDRIRIGHTTTSQKLASDVSHILSELGIVHSVYIRDNRHRGHKTVYVNSILSAGIDTFLNRVKPFKAHKLGR